ncbi:MAG: cation diffusion facilitator family transporter, partial [Thermoleophilaceae bacterium]
MSGRSRRRVAAAATAPGLAVGPAAQAPRKERAAAISILSNTLLIALKVVAGIVTGSIAILTEAAHSAIDLVASVIAFFSVRKADQPADESHPYGHDKVENVAAGIEGMLILVGAGVIVFESLRRL